MESPGCLSTQTCRLPPRNSSLALDSVELLWMTCWDVWVQCREHLLEANLTSGNYKKGKRGTKETKCPCPWHCWHDRLSFRSIGSTETVTMKPTVSTHFCAERNSVTSPIWTSVTAWCSLLVLICLVFKMHVLANKFLASENWYHR